MSIVLVLLERIYINSSVLSFSFMRFSLKFLTVSSKPHKFHKSVFDTKLHITLLLRVDLNTISLHESVLPICIRLFLNIIYETPASIEQLIANKRFLTNQISRRTSYTGELYSSANFKCFSIKTSIQDLIPKIYNAGN